MDIYFTYQFLEDQKVKQEKSCEFFEEKNFVLSDLTPDVRSYPVLLYESIYKTEKKLYSVLGYSTGLLFVLMIKSNIWFQYMVVTGTG